MTDAPQLDEANPSLGDIARAVNAVHSCIDGFRREQALENAAARRKRHALANSVTGIQGQVKRLVGDVGDLKVQQDLTSGRVTTLSQLFGAEKAEKGKRPKGTTLATMPWWKVAGGALGALSGLVLLFQLLAPAVAAFFVEFYHSVMAHQ